MDEENNQNLILNTEEVDAMLNDALAGINNQQNNAFAGFDEPDDDDEIEELQINENVKQTLLKIQTLVRVFDDDQPLKVAYIRHGYVKEMEPFMKLITSAMTAQFRGKNAAGAYSESLIAAKEEELKKQFKLLDIEPTQEERTNARLFDEHYRSLV